MQVWPAWALPQASRGTVTARSASLTNHRRALCQPSSSVTGCERRAAASQATDRPPPVKEDVVQKCISSSCRAGVRRRLPPAQAADRERLANRPAVRDQGPRCAGVRGLEHRLCSRRQRTHQGAASRRRERIVPGPMIPSAPGARRSCWAGRALGEPGTLSGGIQRQPRWASFKLLPQPPPDRSSPPHGACPGRRRGAVEAPPALMTVQQLGHPL